jgi:hypothetical protein
MSVKPEPSSIQGQGGFSLLGGMMKVQLLEYFRSFLLKAPPYTSTFLYIQEWSEPVIVMRVEELERFRGEFRAQVGFRTWQNSHSTWVVAVPFRLHVPPRLRIDGLPCLNPRRATDYDMMQRFTSEESIRFLFFSADLTEAEDIQVPWPAAQRTRVQRQITRIDDTLTGARITGPFDADFEHAKQEFQALLDTSELAGYRLADHS